MRVSLSSDEQAAACAVHALVDVEVAPTLVQLPAEEVEAYQKGQHLRKQDALLSERVRAEVVRRLPSKLRFESRKDR